MSDSKLSSAARGMLEEISWDQGILQQHLPQNRGTSGALTVSYFLPSSFETIRMTTGSQAGEFTGSPSKLAQLMQFKLYTAGTG